MVIVGLVYIYPCCILRKARFGDQNKVFDGKFEVTLFASRSY